MYKLLKCKLLTILFILLFSCGNEVAVNDTESVEGSSGHIQESEVEKPEPVRHIDVPLVDVDASVFNRKKVEAETQQGQLLSESVDYSSTTVNYFNAEEHDTSDFETFDDGEELKVVDYGPIGKVPNEMRKPVIHVMFSHPMVPISKLGEPLTEFEYLNIEPKIEGVYRWYGSKLLSFEANEALVDSSGGYDGEYKVTLSKDITSVTGKQLQEDFVYNFHLTELEMVNLILSDDKGTISSTNNIPFSSAYKPLIRFNMPVDIETLKSGLDIRVNAQSVPYKMEHPGDGNEHRNSRSVQVTIDDEVQFFNSQNIDVFLMKGAMARKNTPEKPNTQRLSYYTLNAFNVEYASSYGYINPSRIEGNRYPTYIYFTQPLSDDQNFSDFISTDLDVDISDYIYNTGRSLLITNLPVEPGDSYTVTINPGIMDIYGQVLEEGKTFELKVPNAQGYVRFPDKSWGSKNGRRGWVESQFTPALIVEHQNLISLMMGASPITSMYYGGYDTSVASVDLSELAKNRAHYSVQNLEDLVNEKGNGTILFNAEAKFYNYNDSETTKYDRLKVQYTDLGLTVRYGFNKIIVWVNSLKDGTPYRDTKVTIYDNSDNIYKTVETDKNGIAVIPVDEGDYNKRLSSLRNRRPYNDFRVEAKTEDDLAEYAVGTKLSAYNHGLYGLHAYYANIDQHRAMLFSDRELYKPGEEISVRGIHWVQNLGEYSPYRGKFSLTLKGQSYRSPVILEVEGTTTETGGMFEKLTLPDSIDPGVYTLTYIADNKKFTTEIKVAYFRRLNFYVTSKIPDRTFTYGDTISIPAKAGYLAGGDLSGANYTNIWTRKQIGYRPPGERWQGYTFGLRNYTGEKRISSGAGTLSGSGEVTHKEVATGHENEGGTYRYIVETVVSDIDHQEISSTASVVVHPSSFYIGTKVGKMTSSWWSQFVKVGEENKVFISLVKPDGELYKSSATVDMEIIKRTWKASYQQGVYDRVNVSYNQVEELIEKSSITIDGDGIVDLDIEESGDYYIKLISSDSEGRSVETRFYFYAYGGGWYFGGKRSENITLRPDRDLYTIGDTAVIMVQSPLREGRYLLSVEREGILEESIITLDEDTTTIEIPIKENFVPRMYVALTSFTHREEAPQSYFEDDLGKPKNLFGLTALNVSTESRILDIEVGMEKDSYRPGEEVNAYIKVTEDGKPVSGAEVTYLAVDRGVIDLVNYHVPNPLEYFYDKDKFPIYTNGDDLRFYLMNPVSYDITSLQGGDGVKMEERSDFNPLAVFEPYLITDANGIAKVTYTLPDTLTTYRTTAIALKSNLIGYREDEVLVKNPINVRSAFPRRLRYRDTGVGEVILQNNDSVEHTVKVSLESDGIDIGGESVKTVNVPAGASYKVPFLLIPSKMGAFKTTITVESEVLNERVIEDMIVEQPIAKEAFTTTGSLIGGDLLAEEAIMIPEAIATNYGSYSIDISATKLGMLKAPISELQQSYPVGYMNHIYDLIPDVLLGDLLTSLGFSRSDSSVREMIREIFSSQTREGWIKVYSGQSQSNSYIDILSLYFLHLAEKQGFSIKREGMNRLAKQLKGNLLKRERVDSLSAFAAYVITISGSDGTDLVNFIMENTDQLSLSGLGYMIVSLDEMSLTKDAKDLWNTAKNYLRLNSATVDINERYNVRWYFDSEIRSISTLAWAGLRIGAHSDILQKMIKTIELRYREVNYKTFSDYLWSLIALKEFADADSLDNLDLYTKVSLAGSELENRHITGLEESSYSINLPIFDDPISSLPKKELHPVTFEKEGTGNLYYSTRIEYGLPSEVAKARDEGISVFMEYETLDGDKLDPSETLVGVTYRVRIVVSTERRRSFMNLEVPIPSGFEIVDPSFATTASYKDAGGINSEEWSRETSYGDEYDFYGEGTFYYTWDDFWIWKNEPDQKIYDNRIVYSWDSFYEGKRELTFLARATNRGIFPTPPAQASLQFEPEVFGRSAGALFVIEE